MSLRDSAALSPVRITVGQWRIAVVVWGLLPEAGFHRVDANELRARTLTSSYTYSDYLKALVSAQVLWRLGRTSMYARRNPNIVVCWLPSSPPLYGGNLNQLVQTHHNDPVALQRFIDRQIELEEDEASPPSSALISQSNGQVARKVAPRRQYTGDHHRTLHILNGWDLKMALLLWSELDANQDRDLSERLGQLEAVWGWRLGLADNLDHLGRHGVVIPGERTGEYRRGSQRVRVLNQPGTGSIRFDLENLSAAAARQQLDVLAQPATELMKWASAQPR